MDFPIIGKIALFGQPVDEALLMDSYTISFFTFILLVFVEFLSWDTAWKKKLEKPANWTLYKSAIAANLEHYLVFGPIAYAIASAYVASSGDFYPRYVSLPGVLGTQAVGYACAHAWMHRTENYWIHKYHHSFSEQSFVRPISANSVTVTEFVVAYALPIVLGTILFRPDVWTMRVSACIISTSNLLIHTPPSILPMDWLPTWAVTNLKHFHHHEKDVRQHYSAPIFDLDGVLGLTTSKGDKKKK